MIIQGMQRDDARVIKFCKDNDILYNNTEKSLEGPFMRVETLKRFSPKFAKCIE